MFPGAEIIVYSGCIYGKGFLAAGTYSAGRETNVIDGCRIVLHSRVSIPIPDSSLISQLTVHTPLYTVISNK